ncbi:ribosome maturation protein [Lipomyces arxii]|uniref:ribosome maturation protein n=1 Tax=Lipomyces arxii TaxID=56418 RepID=UPI0034CE9472
MSQLKVFYKGESDDFAVVITSPDEYKKYLKDSTVPLVDVVDVFKVFVTHKSGFQGILDEASRASLENEFGTKNIDDVIVKILKEGEFQEQRYAGRSYDSKNDSIGARVAH